MKVWIQKPERESEAPLLMAEHRGIAAFADWNALVRGTLGLLLAALLPGLFGRVRVRRRDAARRKGAFRGRRQG